MGATSWHYFTPYQANPETALQRLRTEVFTQGHYFNPAASPDEYIRRLYERAGLGVDSPECRAAIEQAVREQQALETGSEEDFRAIPRASRSPIRRARDLLNTFGQPPRRNRRAPTTIDDLVEQAAECGTHSILDISHVSPNGGDGVATPLPDSDLLQVFGSTEPVQAQVEAHWADIAEQLDRWRACYFVVFLEGNAKEYAFIGCSGD